MVCKDYRDLIAWQKAMDLAIMVYKVTAKFPREELYGLTAQLRKSGVSVPSNIAEGQGRRSKREFLHHLSIAHGSLSEAETQLLIARRLDYLEKTELDDVMNVAAETGRLVNGLINSLADKQ